VAAIERFLQELQELKAKNAEASLKPGTDDQTEFGYGRACGQQLGLQLAEELLNKILSDSDDDGISRRSG
jgi:hypothetical protein